jgi:hypothetical protein
MTLASLRDKQRRLNRAEDRHNRARAERDAEIVEGARQGHRYRDLAETTGLSVAAIGKIAAAGGIRRYKHRDSGDPSTLTGENDHGTTTKADTDTGERRAD